MVGLTLMTPAISLCAAESPSQKPNIIFILIDDLGYGDLGCYGNKIVETPNIDRLCNAGLKMTQAYVTAPVCSPSRASILTGKHCLELGMWNASHRVKKETLIYPKLLSATGYQTWHIGKWHMGCLSDGTSPVELGFDFGIGGDEAWACGSQFWPYYDPKHPDFKGTMVPDLVPGGHEGEYLADRLTEEALKRIDQRVPDKPFYLNLWHYGVHTPHEAKAEVVAKYKQKLAQYKGSRAVRIDPATGAKYLSVPNSAVYCAMIESVDESVGRIVERLKKEGLYENTLFIFFSDNGPVSCASIAPLRGYKNSLYEGGVRVPAFFTWEGKIKPGESAGRIWTLDLFKTILDVAKVPVPSGVSGDEGMSLAPLLFAGTTVPPRDFYWYFPEDRLGWGQRASTVFYSKDGFKYHLFFGGDAPELYDMKNDEGERVNLATQYPEKAENYRRQLIGNLKSVYPILPAPAGEYKCLIPNIEEALGLGRKL
jgi:arylsulfatase A-like enzyme